MKLTLMMVAVLAAALSAGCASKGKEAELPKSAYGCPMGSKGGQSMEDLIEAKVSSAGSVPDVRVTEMRCRVQNDLLRRRTVWCSACHDAAMPVELRVSRNSWPANLRYADGPRHS